MEIEKILDEVKNYMMSHLEIRDIDNCIREALKSDIAYVKKSEEEITTIARLICLRDLIGNIHFYYQNENFNLGFIKSCIRICLEQVTEDLLRRNTFNEVLIDNGFQFTFNARCEGCSDIKIEIKF